MLFMPNAANTSKTSADNPGVNSENGNLQLWGPANFASQPSPTLTEPPAANGFAAGGNFVGSDPQFQNGAISQTIGGLTVGATYTLAFEWAAAQQAGFTGATTEGWQVSLGSSTQCTDPSAPSSGLAGPCTSTGSDVVNLGSKDFIGWMDQSMTFTATAVSEVLSFLAIGTDSGNNIPPFALLDDVSLTPNTGVPEPSSLGILAVSLLGLGGLGMYRRRKIMSGTTA